MNIVRIWLYSVTHEELKDPGCKPSDTNKLVTKKVRGDFEYWDIQDQNFPHKVSRKIANKWKEDTGKKVDTLRGYPTFMYDLGYRA